MELVLPGIFKHIINIEITAQEEIPDDIQHTKERKPDFLKKITDQQGKVWILHIEYQVSQDANMVYRMAEYCIMLKRKYRLGIKQYVIYLGMAKAGMKTSIQSTYLTYSYKLLTLSAIDYRIFLQSTIPEEKILAVLADFGEKPPDQVMEEIINAIQRHVLSELDLGRYLNQIRVFGQLRNLNKQIIQTMDSLSAIWKEEKDILFSRGRLRGKAEGKAEGRKELARKIALEMKAMQFKPEVISKLTKLSCEELAKLEQPGSGSKKPLK